MSVLVLGGSGMLGHKVAQVLSTQGEVVATFRGEPSPGRLAAIGDAQPVFPVQAGNLASIEEVLDRVRPSTVVNCIGVVKQLAAGKDPITCISINALFPHQLQALCQPRGIRLMCISTDCVFSGEKGGYRETDMPDATDLYGRTKLLGEVEAEGALTVRTSIIGRELSGASGLIEWFLSQAGKTARGYRKAIFSGVTTRVLADILGRLIRDHRDLHGLYQLASQPICKYDLLQLVNRVYSLGVEIEPDQTFACDRSLEGGRFRDVTGIVVPAWDAMIRDMHDDPTDYDAIRRPAAPQPPAAEKGSTP